MRVACFCWEVKKVEGRALGIEFVGVGVVVVLV